LSLFLGLTLINFVSLSVDLFLSINRVHLGLFNNCLSLFTDFWIPEPVQRLKFFIFSYVIFYGFMGRCLVT